MKRKYPRERRSTPQVFGVRQPLVVLMLLALFAAQELLWPPRAYAYLDPGAGSLLFQFLVAAVLGALMTIKLTWRHLVAIIRRLFSRPP